MEKVRYVPEWRPLKKINSKKFFVGSLEHDFAKFKFEALGLLKH